MKTKTTLLGVMKRENACTLARDFVRKYPSDSALEIGQSCKEIGWLYWFLSRRLRDPEALLNRLCKVSYVAQRARFDRCCQCGCLVNLPPDEDSETKVRKILLECWEAWCQA